MQMNFRAGVVGGKRDEIAEFCTSAGSSIDPVVDIVEKELMQGSVRIGLVQGFFHTRTSPTQGLA